MDQESLSIVHRYISIEWARKALEHDMKRIQHAGLKYPALFEGAAVKLLDRLSLQMRDIKQLMRQKDIKVVYRGMNKDSVEYEIYVGKRKYPWEYAPEIEKALSDIP